MMPRFIRCVSALVFVTAAALPLLHAQVEMPSNPLNLESVTFNATAPVALPSKSVFKYLRSYGGGAEAEIRVSPMFSIVLGGSFSRVDVSEDDPITNWNWAYWQRYYASYLQIWFGSDSAYHDGQKVTLSRVSPKQWTAGKWIGKDSLYAVELRPVEYVNTTPVSLSFAATFPVTKALHLHGRLTGTLLIYERNMYLDEKWEKRRRADAGPDSGQVYVFQYGYHNYAPPKSGVLLGVGGGVAADYRLSSLIGVHVAADYSYFLNSFHKGEYDLFPFKGTLSLSAGFSIYY